VFSAATQLLNILHTDRSNLLAFLRKHGTWLRLKQIIQEIERRYPDNIRVWYRLMAHSETCPNRIFELPTDELCITLIRMFSHLKVQGVIDVGAGSGLLTARLKQLGFSGRLRAIDSGSWEAIHPVFDKVEKLRIAQLKRDSDDMSLIFSWMHKDMEPEMKEMIKKLSPKRMWFIGDPMGPGGSCGSVDFHKWLLAAARGYQCVTINALQIGHTDYYSNNPYQQKTEDKVTSSNIAFYTMVGTEQKMTEEYWEKVIGKRHLADRVIHWHDDIAMCLYDTATMKMSKEFEFTRDNSSKTRKLKK